MNNSIILGERMKIRDKTYDLQSKKNETFR